MGVFRSGNNDGIEILRSNQLFRMLEGPRSFAVILLIGCDRLLTIVAPQVADRRHLNVLLLLQSGNHAVELAAARADTDMAKRYAIVGAQNAVIRKRVSAQCRCPGGDHSSVLNKCSAVHLGFPFHSFSTI